MKKRKRAGIDSDVVIGNTLDVIVSTGGLQYRPAYFCIDSLPQDDDDDDCKCTMLAREAIIKYIATLHGALTQSLLVAKTPALQVEDAKLVAELNGKIHGYNEKMIQLKAEAKDVLSAIQADYKRGISLRADKCDAEAELEDLRKDELVPTKQWSLEEEWKFKQSQSAKFNVSSAWPITKYKCWASDPDKLQWVSVEVDDGKMTVSGRVEGKFMRGLFANVTLLTTKEEKYKKRIAELIERLKDITKELAEHTSEKKAEENAKHREEIDNFKQYIANFKADTEECLRRSMDLETAHKRLGKLK